MKKLTAIWCWIVGHNLMCLKRHSIAYHDNYAPHTTLSVHKCARCHFTWQEQWDQ